MNTPGPWKMHDSEYCPEEIWGNLNEVTDIEGGYGTLVCTVSGRNQQEVIANAHLIKAAPDLLAALDILLADMEAVYRDDNGDMDHDGMDKARAAIAKATMREKQGVKS